MTPSPKTKGHRYSIATLSILGSIWVRITDCHIQKEATRIHRVSFRLVSAEGDLIIGIRHEVASLTGVHISAYQTMPLLLSKLEAHAALTQAFAAIVSMLIAAAALAYAVKSLWSLQRQTNASIATLSETFRPILEVLGGSLGAASVIDFKNKGNGAALNLRWRADCAPERWCSYPTNMLAPQEQGQLKGSIDWQNGLVLSYNSVASKKEILTYVKFTQDGTVINNHAVDEGYAQTRLGWTIIDPKLAVPAFHPDFVSMMPLRSQLWHWWQLKRGRERRL